MQQQQPNQETAAPAAAKESSSTQESLDKCDGDHVCERCQALRKIDRTRKPVLHMIGLFHTVPSARQSHCAFTGKVLRFGKMMTRQGYHVIEYANGQSESEASEKVMLMSEDRLNQLLQRKTEDQFVGMDAVIGSPAWHLFNSRLVEQMHKRVLPGDIICHPFGKVHESLISLFPSCYHIETGIGYPDTWLEFRVFESSAWMHYHLGKEASGGKNYCNVVPNYFDLEEWPVVLQPKGYKVTTLADGKKQKKAEQELIPGGYVLYFGRIDPVKGMETVVEVANRVDKQVVICGQGDPAPWLEKCPKLKYLKPIKGKQRAKLVGNALCVLMPTVFVEPFGGSGVEAMLCGTPLLAVDYGAFKETIIHGVTGFRCNTLGDWLDGVKVAHVLDRKTVAEETRKRYSLEAVGKLYDTIFKRLQDMSGKGWYEEASHGLQGEMARELEQKKQQQLGVVQSCTTNQQQKEQGKDEKQDDQKSV